MRGNGLGVNCADATGAEETDFEHEKFSERVGSDCKRSAKGFERRFRLT